ncbi:von Willebrand factor, type A [Phaffia rhodozyma]|uniref:von Willebrand factor, type A n=1 Tax=Phaffia rhodozyma TaxID=264483 RepID=A0A0F7SF96_PHARH|nr:von Willebrand factor, type A [Phaffia rhodozyma]
MTTTARAASDPTYAHDIILSYCSRKIVRGRSRYETGYKLHLLEWELVFRKYPIPDLGNQVLEVRETLGLPESHIFRRSSNPSQAALNHESIRFSSASIDRRRASDAQIPIHRPNNFSRATTPASTSIARPPRPPVVRASDRGDGATTPPPAYERTDPNPDSDLASAIIASLSVEQSSSGLRPSYNPPSGPPPSSSTDPGFISRRNVGGRSLEDPLLLLSTYHTYFLLDDSTSMQKDDRWADMVKAISSVVPLAANFDPEGVELHFVNSKEGRKGVRTEEEVEDVFARVIRPEGHTRMSLKLDTLLRNYIDRLESLEAGLRPLNLIVMTDGASLRASSSNTNPFVQSESPESIIAAAAKRLDHGNYPSNQLGIFFLQIGDDAEAREFLQDMDDSLPSRHNVRDLVDTISFNGLTSELNANDIEIVRKILLGGVDKRIDREL